MPINGEIMEYKFATYSGPTLLSMKVGSLFSIDKKEIPNYHECIKYFDTLFSCFGIRLTILKESEKCVHLYLFSYEQLSHLLKKENIRNFLSELEYPLNGIENDLQYLKERMNSHDFPHEIGIFLGYPLGDVKGFVDHQPCKMNGLWKVYSNEKNISKLFIRYKQINRYMLSKISDGMRIEEIIQNIY